MRTFWNTIMATHRSALHQCQTICEHDGCSSSVLYIFLDISQSLPKVMIITRRQQNAFLFLAFDKTAGYHCWNILMLALLVYQMVSSRQHLSVIYVQWFSTCSDFLHAEIFLWAFLPHGNVINGPYTIINGPYTKINGPEGNFNGR